MKNERLSKIAAYVGMFALIFGLQACDTFGVKSTGDLMTLEFDETDFEGLDLCLSGKAEVRVGDEFKVEITCEESAMPYLETKVEDDILKVYFSRNVYDVDHLKIVVTAPSWKRFEVSGSGDAQVNVSDVLDAEISGSGTIVYKGDPQVNAHVSGSGSIKQF